MQLRMRLNVLAAIISFAFLTAIVVGSFFEIGSKHTGMVAGKVIGP
jgi:hypothetical protein